MKKRSGIRRKATNAAANSLSAAAALVGIGLLVWILLVVAGRGGRALDWDFFTKTTPPPGTAKGGMANAIVGTFLLTASGMLIGTPIGMLAGVFLAEFGKQSRFGATVRYCTNVMMGIPSIVAGVFVYSLVVLPAGGFSGWAGAVALALLILPVMSRTTEDILSLVPDTVRESALALGAPRWRVTFGVVFRSARVGLLTGALLALARISGETAPLLFTALNSPYWPTSLSEPTANLTVTIFNFAMSPYPDWQRLAWGGAFLITSGVLIVNVISRLVMKGGCQ